MSELKFWKTISVPSTLIECIREKNYLLKVPNSEYYFWHPIYWVELKGHKSQLVHIKYSNDYMFTIFKCDVSPNNFYTRKEGKKVNVAEFEKYFFLENITDAA